MTDELTGRTEPIPTPNDTRPLAEAAARMAGLDPTGAVLLRHQTNGVYRLVTAPVVIKVARPGEHHLAAVTELVSWLHRHGVPSVALWGRVRQPLEVSGRAVTLWQYLPQDRTIRAADLARPLLALHNTEVPPFSLPPHNPFGAIRNSIATSELLTDQERDALLGQCSVLADEEQYVRFESGPSLIHGDPQHRNALHGPGRTGTILCDWESATVAPREWDLITVEVHCRRFNHPPGDYDAFCRRYGRDIREWPGYTWLRNLRELRMITTNARKSPSGSPAAAEVHRRIRSLGGGETSAWRIL